MTLAGVAMLVLPGPAFIVIPMGLAILATEFEWAQRWLDVAKDKFRETRQKYRQRREARSNS